MNGGPRRIHYHPALDGLRTIAVVAVVLFHAGVARATGGFLGVSLFFTLSGFLITRLLLAEQARDGRIALGAFWGRRVRRLAPAALLCLLAVLASSPWLVRPVEVSSLRGDVIASAANVANWRFLTAGQSYAQLFAGRPSPVLHFWSLAIEEQFYFVFPCVVALLLAVRRRWALPVGLGLLAVASLAATLAATDHDLIYYGTHTRAGELLIGALAAWLLFRFPAALDAPVRLRAVTAAATLGTVGFVGLVITTEQTDGWLYHGGFLAVAVLWCPMIVAATTSSGWAKVVGWPPLATIGRRSYGIYVFHWPVFTLVTPSVLHLGGWVARSTQLVIIAVLTEVSFRFVEAPVRERRVLRSATAMRLTSLATIAAVIVAALVAPTAAEPSGQRISMLDAPDIPVLLTPKPLEASAGPASGSGSGEPTHPVSVSPVSVASPTPTPTPTPPPPPPLRIAVIGSELPVARAVWRAAADGAGARVINRVVPHCTPIDFADPWPLDPSCPSPPAPAPPADLLVIALGPADHRAFTDRLDAIRSMSSPAQYSIAEYLDHLGVSAFEQFAGMARSVVVVDTVPPSGDFLDRIVEEAAVSTTTISRRPLDSIDPSFVAAFAAGAPSSAVAPGALRIMVIGDSTSYGVATGVANSSEQVEVLWAGKRNCALIATAATTLANGRTPSAGCPTTISGWPEAVASFRPDVVVAVASLPEEAEQQYAGDPAWYAPGSPRYTLAHVAGMADLVALAATTGAVVEVATAPGNPTTGTQGWTTDAGIAAWNAQVLAWDTASPVVESIDYGGLVTAAEATAGHSLRPDGAHLDDASVTAIIGGSLAPLLVRQATALRAVLAASGCLVNEPSGQRLDLNACR